MCACMCAYLNKDISLERMKNFFTEDYQLINVEEMRKLENHHFATTNVITDSDKNLSTSEWKDFKKQYTHSRKFSPEGTFCLQRRKGNSVRKTC